MRDTFGYRVASLGIVAVVASTQPPLRAYGPLADPPIIYKGRAAVAAAPGRAGAVVRKALAPGLTADPTAVSWASGRIDVFVRGADNALWHKSYAGSWSAWESLGGSISSGPDVSSWGQNRLDVFARGTDGTLYHKPFNGSWGAWEQLGANPITGDPSAVSWGAGRIDVFVRGTDNGLYHKYFQNRWSGYESLGGVVTSGPDASSWGPNRLDVFVRGTDNALYHKSWDGTRWSGFESLGGSLASDPSAVSWGTGRIDVFARGSDNTLQHKSFSNGWSGWESLGGAFTSAPDASSWAANRLDVFAVGTDGMLYHKWFDGMWSGWEPQGAPNATTANTLLSTKASVIGMTQGPTPPAMGSFIGTKSSPTPSDPAKGHYRVTLNGFTCSHETWDNALQADGKRDEIFLTSHVTVFDATTSNQLDASKRSLTMGDVNGFPYRVRAGSASAQGGIQTGDQIFGTPWLRTGDPQPDQLPMLLWEGDLVDGRNAVTIIPAIWEYDGGQDVFNDWVKWNQQAVQNLRNSTSFLSLVGLKGKIILDVSQLALNDALRLSDNSILGNAYDRPIGFVARDAYNYTFNPQILAFNYSTAEFALSNNFGYGNGIIPIRYVDAPKFAGDYTIYVQIEKVP